MVKDGMMMMMQASSRRRSKVSKSRVTASSDDETSRSTEPSRKCSTESTARMSTTKSARTRVTSSDSETSSSSSDDVRHDKSTTGAAVSKSRVITSSSESDDSSDNDVTLLKNRGVTSADKSRKTATAPQRQSIYTSSDDDDDSDSDSVTTTPLKKHKQTLSTSTPKMPPTKKPVPQSTSKKPPASGPSGGSSKVVSKPSIQRESSTDSDVISAAKNNKSAVKDTKKAVRTSDKDSRPDNMLSSTGQAAKKEVKKPTKSTANKPAPAPLRHASSSFIDALTKSAMQAKVMSKIAKDEKVVRKDSASHRTSAVCSTVNRTKPTKPSHVESKHSTSDSRHTAKPSSSGSIDKKVASSDRPLKCGGYDPAHENTSKSSEAETVKSKKIKLEEETNMSCSGVEAELDGSPLIRPGNIFEKMEKQDSSVEKVDEPCMYGQAESGAHRHSIAVFMPESDDEDREPTIEPTKLERLKEESAKEETIEEAVKAIIEFTKEPSTPPLSSSKATDSEPLEDTSIDTADDELGLSDDVGELNAAIGNLIEKELEPVGGDGLTTHGSCGSKASESPTHYHPSIHGGLAETKTELPPFVTTRTGSSLKEEPCAMKIEARHMQTSAHDEQNVTSFMSRLEKATADVVDFASISAAAAASHKLAEKTTTSSSSSETKPDVSSRLFAGASCMAPVKTEDEKPVVVKKEECSEVMEKVKAEPPELPLTTKTLLSKPTETPGASTTEKGVVGGSTEPGSGEDSSTMTDLYEFKDDDEDDEHGRQKEFVLHKRSRKRQADSESNDAGDGVEVKKSRSSINGGSSHVKTEHHQAARDQGPAVTMTSDAPSASSQSSWRTNMDLVIDAVARGEFERGDDFNYYSSQTSSTTGKGRRGRGASRDDTTHKTVPPASTPACPTSSLPLDAYNVAFQRSISAVSAGGDHCSPKLLLASMSSPQQLQQYRLGPPGTLPAPGELTLSTLASLQNRLKP